MTAKLREIKVFTTFPHRCSYLEGQEATTLFVDPRQRISTDLYTELSLMGFRRSGDHVYRPHCGTCKACIPSRIAINDFALSKSQRRVVRRNRDLAVTLTNDVFDDEAYTLYKRYIKANHSDGDMYPPDREQYESFLNNGLGCSQYYRLYENNKLVCITVADVMLDGFAAIYTFYEPELHQRSLGTYAVLLQIKEAGNQGLPYVYLGYWIENCKKMSYKTRFAPLEFLVDGEWTSQMHNDDHQKSIDHQRIPQAIAFRSDKPLGT